MISRRLLAGLVAFLGFTAVLGVEAARRAGPPVLVVRYREALRSWFPAGSVMSLDAVDLTGAERARIPALAFVVVDHAVRRFAPMAIDASGRAAQSGRLRRLPPIVDTSTALAARTSLALTLGAVDGSATAGRQPRLAAAIAALRSAERSVVYASQVNEACAPPGRRARGRAALSPTCMAIAEGAMTEASQVAASALEAGAEPPVLVEACLQSLRDLTRIPGAAR